MYMTSYILYLKSQGYYLIIDFLPLVFSLGLIFRFYSLLPLHLGKSPFGTWI